MSTRDNIHENTDFSEGSLLALKNAKEHFAVAQSAEGISLGIANSHLILAAEEAIKADVLSRVSITDEWLEHLNLDEFFRSHNHKHQEIVNDFGIDLFLQHFLGGLMDWGDEIQQLNVTPEEKEKIVEEWKDNFAGWSKRRHVELRRQHRAYDQWWKNANKMKNQGFYVGLKKQTGEWDSPSDITKEQFEKSLEIVSRIIRDIEKRIEMSR